MPMVVVRNIEGALMVEIPPSVLAEAGIAEGSKVELTVDRERNSIALRSTRPRYRLADLLAEIASNSQDDEETKAWLADRPRGGEMI